jgi:hypothetical protein
MQDYGEQKNIHFAINGIDLILFECLKCVDNIFSSLLKFNYYLNPALREKTKAK